MFLEIVAAFWFAVISVISIPANVFVIVIIFLKKVDCLDYYHLLLVTQSCRDILLNVLVIFYTVATLAHGCIVLGQDYCRLSAYFSRVWYFGTALTLSALTTERFKSIQNCMNHERRITPKRLLIVIVVLNLFPILAGLPLVLGRTKFLHVTTVYGCANDAMLDIHDTEVQIMGIILFLVLIIPVVFIFKTSVKMFLLVKRHKQTIEINQPGEIAPENTNETLPTEKERYKAEKTKYMQKARDIQMAKRVLVVNSSFLLSLTPILILKLYARFHDENLTTTPTWFILLVYWMNYCCTISNPVTNALRRRDFRRVLRKVFTGLRSKVFGRNVTSFSREDSIDDKRSKSQCRGQLENISGIL